MFVPIELRRALISDAFGDYNFLRFPNEIRPFPDYRTDLHDRWCVSHRSYAPYTAFIGGVTSLHLRYLKVETPGNIPVLADHWCPSFGILGGDPWTNVMRASTMALVGVGGELQFSPGTVWHIWDAVLDDEDEFQAAPSQPFSYARLYTAWSPQGGGWGSGIRLYTDGYLLTLDELRVWERVDIEPYLEDLIPFNGETEVFQQPFGRYFVGTHARPTRKGVTLTFLFSRSDDFRTNLQKLLAFPDHRYPLELFVDGYLFRVALEGWRIEPVGGLVLRAILDLTFLRPYGFHEERKVIASNPSPLGNPLIVSVNYNGTVEGPCEVRFVSGSAINGYKVRLFNSASGQRVTYQMAGDESGKVISVQESGKVLMATVGQPTIVTDVTHRLSLDSQVPLRLHPGLNILGLEFLDANDNHVNDTNPWRLVCAFNPRCGEVTAL
jgi:hypothetical protein